MAKRFYITRVKDTPPPPPPTLVAYRVKDRRTGATLATFSVPAGVNPDSIRSLAFSARDTIAEAVQESESDGGTLEDVAPDGGTLEDVAPDDTV